MVFCRENIDNTGSLSLIISLPWLISGAALDNICFTVMTSFPLHFSRLSRTSIPQPASPARSNPPLEKAIDPPLLLRTDRTLRGQSNSLARNAGDHLSRLETRPCPPPSSGGRRQVQILGGRADGRDGSLGNVDAQRRDAVHLNAQSNASCDSFLKTLKREEIYANQYRDLDHLRANIEEFIERYYNQQRLHSALGYFSGRI